MSVKLTSFAYRSGDVPSPSTLTVDCRKLANPHSNPGLRPLDGKAKLVQQYVQLDPKFDGVFREALAQARDGAHIAFGCFGGRHRSVALVELVARALLASGQSVTIHHRDLAA